MAKHRILVASYTNSIHALQFDGDASLTAQPSIQVGHHPSWIEFHPQDPSLVFAAIEQTEGKIVAVKYDPSSGNGAIVGEIASGGADPCSLYATNDRLFVANYSSGSLSVLPISSQAPYLLDGPTTTVQLHGSGPNLERQTGPHAHQVLLLPSRGELLVADLGADVVCRFAQQDGIWKLQARIGFEPGSGPRHTAVYDGALYTLNELNSTLSKHRFPPLPAEPSLIAVKPTMANPPPAPTDMLAAELLIPAPNSSFPTAYAYVSNRNDPSPEGDIISIFAIEGVELELVAEVRTGLKHLRGMLFGGVDQRWLVAGGAQGGGVKVFERVDGGKGLKLVAENKEVEAPTGFLWV
ncbi:Lactonase, 7-bladed beta-propeller-domain-containing protein [Roridomyces roridus]|uniref:Lactonase, 7-bladed beta-propeller-domain-containing protein n=1 Tax=Roridomyces roridus TaxID=1738132 RepID=A0AAD7FJ79_9AGAR|nr:Lactonase, 7-bladed beta-propeller-domain-containing protein [Roridomyces roridus]